MTDDPRIDGPAAEPPARPTYADLPRLCVTYADLGSFGTYTGLATTTPDHKND